MHLITFNDKLGNAITYDADMKIKTADDGLAFFLSQLTSVEARIYEVKYRNIVYQNFVPVDTSDPEWVDDITYISFDAVTMGKFIGANAKDLPQSDITASKSLIPVFYGGNSYSYSLDELRKSQALQRPVDVAKAQASRRGFEEHAQKVAFFGDLARNVTGLFNNANIASDTSSVDWATATGQEIVSDANDFLFGVWSNSAEVHVPGVLLLPSSKWSQISTKRMDSGTDTTVLSFLRANNLYTDVTGQPLTIMPNLELETAGAASAPRMMSYELNDENLTMKMPMPWRTVTPQPEGLQITVPGEYKFGGVEFRYPGSAAYRDFI